MRDTLILIVAVVLSALFFNYLFYKLNDKFKLFEGIRTKIENFDEKKKNRLRTISFVLVIIGYLITDKMNNLMHGLFFGLLLSFRDICFKDTLLENIK